MGTQKLLCFREALIDRIASTYETAFKPLAASAVFNTAIGIRRKGVDLGLISGLSGALFGGFLVNKLQESPVDTSYLCRSDRPTALTFVTHVDGNANYTFYDEKTADRMMLSGDICQTLLNAKNAQFFEGISLAVGPCIESYVVFLRKKRVAADHFRP